MKLRTVILSLLLCAGCLSTVQAQTMPEVEQQIKDYLEGISYWRFQYAPEDTSFGYEVSKEDSVNNINTALFNYIKDVVAKVPGIIKHPPKLPENSDMKIITSPDKKVCVYSWEAHTISHNHSYNNVFVLAGGVMWEGNDSKVQKNQVSYSEVEAEIIEIMEVPYSNGGKIYLTVSKVSLSENEVLKSLSAYTIDNRTFAGKTMFSKDGNQFDSIEYIYDYMSNYDFEKMQEINTIHLSKNKKKLYIPEVENNQMTGKWLVYVFDGTNFVYDEKAK